MLRSLALGLLSFPLSGLAFVIGWLARDIRFGLLAGAIVFTLFLAATVISLFYIKDYSYANTAMPAVFAVLWSLALAPFSFGSSLFSAPACIGAALVLGACMVTAKRYRMQKAWLIFPALVFLYEMLPVNIPGPVDDYFALSGSIGVMLVQFLRRKLTGLIKDSLRDISANL